MKILQLIDRPQPRGAEIFSWQLSKHLNLKGTQAIVVAIFSSCHGGFLSIDIGLNRNRFFRWIDFPGYYQLSKVISDVKPDLIQANAGDTLRFAVFSKVLLGWKTPIVYRNANTISGFLKNGLHRWFYKLLLSRIDHVVSVTQYTADDFKKLFDWPQEKIDVIPIGIESEINSLSLDPQLLGFFSDGPVICNIAAFVNEKNHPAVIRIFYALLKQIPNAKLLLVGSGPEKNRIKNQVESLGLKSRVLMLENRIDVRCLIRNSSTLLLTSTNEGLPAVILEALSEGCPVVTSDVGGISEVIKNGITGFIHNVKEESKMVNSLWNLISDQELRYRITDEANRLVHQDYLNQTIAEKFMVVYIKILALPDERIKA